MSLTLLLSATPSARGVQFASHGIGARLCFCFLLFVLLLLLPYPVAYSFTRTRTLYFVSALGCLTLVALQKKKQQNK